MTWGNDEFPTYYKLLVRYLSVCDELACKRSGQQMGKVESCLSNLNKYYSVRRELGRVAKSQEPMPRYLFDIIG